MTMKWSYHPIRPTSTITLTSTRTLASPTSTTLSTTHHSIPFLNITLPTLSPDFWLHRFLPNASSLPTINEDLKFYLKETLWILFFLTIPLAWYLAIRYGDNQHRIARSPSPETEIKGEEYEEDNESGGIPLLKTPQRQQTRSTSFGTSGGIPITTTPQRQKKPSTSSQPEPQTKQIHQTLYIHPRPNNPLHSRPYNHSRTQWLEKHQPFPLGYLALNSRFIKGQLTWAPYTDAPLIPYLPQTTKTALLSLNARGLLTLNCRTGGYKHSSSVIKTDSHARTSVGDGISITNWHRDFHERAVLEFVVPVNHKPPPKTSKQTTHPSQRPPFIPQKTLTTFLHTLLRSLPPNPPTGIYTTYTTPLPPPHNRAMDNTLLTNTHFSLPRALPEIPLEWGWSSRFNWLLPFKRTAQTFVPARSRGRLYWEDFIDERDLPDGFREEGNEVVFVRVEGVDQEGRDLAGLVDGVAEGCGILKREGLGGLDWWETDLGLTSRAY